MSNITVEMLKERFQVKDVAPYGACIVVPGDKFDPDWEAELGDKGHKVVMTSLDGKVVTLVKLEEDKKDPAANLQSKVWSQDDAETLLKRMRELPGTMEQKCVLLAKEFKGRSPAAIHQKYVKLQRRLKKQARPKKERKGPVKPEQEEGTLAERERRMRAPTSTPKRTPEPPAEDPVVKKLTDTLDALVDLVDKLSCNAVMHALEIRELKSKDDFKIPLGLWTSYTNALLEDDKQYREKFRLKVEQLLEASA